MFKGSQIHFVLIAAMDAALREYTRRQGGINMDFMTKQRTMLLRAVVHTEVKFYITHFISI